MPEYVHQTDGLLTFIQVRGKVASGETFAVLAVVCYRPQPFTVRTIELSQILRLSSMTPMNLIGKNMEDETIAMNNLFEVHFGFDS